MLLNTMYLYVLFIYKYFVNRDDRKVLNSVSVTIKYYWQFHQMSLTFTLIVCQYRSNIALCLAYIYLYFCFVPLFQLKCNCV